MAAEVSFRYEVEYAMVRSALSLQPPPPKDAGTGKSKKKAAKEGPAWQPGFLITSPSTGWIWLKDATKVTIKKGTIRPEIMAAIVVGATVSCAGCELKIIKDLSTTPAPLTSSSSRSSSSNSAAMVENIPVGPPNSLDEQSLKRKAASSSSSSSDDVVGDDARTKKHTTGVSVDPLLDAVMRPHQKEAAAFLISKLQGDAASMVAPAAAEQEVDHIPTLPWTGAILADDMGTGKTLVGIAVLWAFCRHGRCKGVVVCPSSLIGNWSKEMTRWLPTTLGRTALFVTGGGSTSGPKSAQSTVALFVTSHASIHPALVISYEMFRSFAAVLNTCDSLEVLVCDEGHRLKNAYGTSTTLALGNCCAVRRLVLTGTPVQNNLEELYAVVQFAVPGYLGTLPEFKKHFSDPIARGKAAGASARARKDGVAATEKLKQRLGRILLRRTRDTVLKAILPPRRDFVVSCALSPSQRECYLREAKHLIGGVEERAAEDGKGPAVLPAIMKLRQVCDFTITLPFTAAATAPASSSSSSSSGGGGDEGNGGSTGEILNDAVARLLADSDKLRVLDGLLTSVRQLRPAEKVVVVSNFTTALDAVELIARSRRFMCLRLDGSVPPERRMKLVQHFNSEQSPFFLMLLSAKAGGVGLNLVGGSRLVLLEPDWNPATDHQAMGRIWRDGQTKAVCIYRFICRGTIEESILRRQAVKGTLSLVVKENSLDGGGGGDDDNGVGAVAAALGGAGDGGVAGAGTDAGLSDDVDLAALHLSPEVLQELVLPRGADAFDPPTAAAAAEGGQVHSTDGAFSPAVVAGLSGSLLQVEEVL